MFIGDRERLEERTDLKLPHGIRQIVDETDFQRMAHAAPSLRLRPSTPGSTTGKHGFGEAPDELRKAELIEYLHRLDARLAAALSNRHEPVIIAGDLRGERAFPCSLQVAEPSQRSSQVNAEALSLAEPHRRTLPLG